MASSQFFDYLKNLIYIKKWKNKDIYPLTISDWNISNNIEDNDLDFNIKLNLKKNNLINFLEISLNENKIHIFFYHKNTSTNPRYMTNAYIFGQYITENDLVKLKECIDLVE